MNAQPIASLSVAEMAALLFECGVLAFPAEKDSKHPYVQWGGNRFPGGWPTLKAHAAMFALPGAQRLFVVCGKRSDGVACIDFDQPTFFEQWAALIYPEILEKLYIEQSQRSGGYHVAFKLAPAVPSTVPARNARSEDGKIGAVRIEVRGEGNGFVAAPSPGYQWIQGDLTALPLLAAAEYDRLLAAAATFNECEVAPEPERPKIIRLASEDELPGTRFNRENRQGEVVALFQRHGYKAGKRDAAGNVAIVRPGATSETSGNVNRDGVLHMFSTNTPFIPSEAGKGNPYTPFAVFTWLEHGGDYAAAGKALYRQYSPPAVRVVRERNAESQSDAIDDQKEDVSSQSSWDTFLSRRVDVWEAITNGIPPQEWLVEPIVLAGKVTNIHGGPGQGKTWVMLYVVREALKKGMRVMILDEESGLRDTAERLQALDLTAEQNALLYYFPFALESNLEEMAATIIEGVLREDIALVAVDSLSKLFAASGLDENSNSDATRLMRAWITVITHIHGRAFLGLDHIVKVEEGTRYGRGASSKLADTDVQWHIEATVPPSRNALGRVVLTNKKDRTATVPGVVRFIIGGDGTGHVQVRIEGTSETQPPPIRKNDRRYVETLFSVLNNGMKSSEWLRAAGGAKSSFDDVRRRLLAQRAIAQSGDLYYVTREGTEWYELGTSVRLVPNQSTGTGGTDSFKESVPPVPNGADDIEKEETDDLF